MLKRTSGHFHLEELIQKKSDEKKSFAEFVKVKTHLKHLFFLRLLAGLIFLIFGITHLICPENFYNILIASKVPFPSFYVIFVPVIGMIVGTFFIIGLYTRLIATLGCVKMALAFNTIYTILHTKESASSEVLIHKLSLPPLFIPLVVFILCLYLLIRGSGPWSLDCWNKKKKLKKN
jgi:uncharacterized membrane protein YphA (DoxX/SURF4 family)